MQNGTGKLERDLRSCFSATDLFAASGEHEDIISPAPITVLFIIWWKIFPCCFPSPSFPSSWLSHMQKQCFLLELEHCPSLSQHFFLSCSSCLSHSLQQSCTALGRARVEYRLVPGCHLAALPTWVLQGATVLTESPQRVQKSGCSTTQHSCPAVLGNDALARHLQRDSISLTLYWYNWTGMLKNTIMRFSVLRLYWLFCKMGSLRGGNL